MTDKKIAGALFDFVGFLTTRPESVEVGSSSTVYGIHNLLIEWAKLRGLKLTEPDIEGWNANPKAFTTVKEVSAIIGAPTIRVLWGDDTVTEVSIIHQAELVHRMGLVIPTKKFGDEPKVEKSA